MKNKIIIALFIIYTLVITILLFRAGKIMTSSATDLSKSQKTIDSLHRINLQKLNKIPDYENKVDSLAQMLLRVDSGIKYLQAQKKTVGAKYEARREDLNGMSSDSLKIIALEK